MKLNFSLKTSVVLLSSALLSSHIYAACTANVDLGGNNITNSGSITATGAITGGSITATVAVTGGSITDGTATMKGGNLTGVKNLTATGTLDVAGKITVNDGGAGSYALPIDRGTKGQTLTTDGAGVSSWGNATLTQYTPTCDGTINDYNVGPYKTVTIVSDWGPHVVTTFGATSGGGILTSFSTSKISVGSSSPKGLVNSDDTKVSLTSGHVYVRCGFNVAGRIKVIY